jgi:hypothetical protein
MNYLQRERNPGPEEIANILKQAFRKTEKTI